MNLTKNEISSELRRFVVNLVFWSVLIWSIWDLQRYLFWSVILTVITIHINNLHNFTYLKFLKTYKHKG